MRINPQEFVSFPKQMVIGFVPASTRMERLQAELDRTGVSEDQVDLLSGEGGLRILVDGGPSATRRQRLVRRIERIAPEGEHLDTAIDQLKAGNSIVTIHRVNADQAPDIREALELAGVGTHHYFGIRTFD